MTRPGKFLLSFLAWTSMGSTLKVLARAPEHAHRRFADGQTPQWPGQVPAGRVDERSVISGIDWLPTLCALTGAPINAADFDGEDVSAAWLGKGEHARTRPLLWKTSAPQSAGAIRDGPWKLHHPNSRNGEMELFDVAADPGEQRNLVKEHPDIAKRLSAKLETWQAKLPKTYDKTDANEDNQ